MNMIQDSATVHPQDRPDPATKTLAGDPNRKLTREERLSATDAFLNDIAALCDDVTRRTGSANAGLTVAWAATAFWDRTVNKQRGINARTLHRYRGMVLAGEAAEVARRLHCQAHARWPFSGPNAPTPRHLMNATA